MTFQSSIMEKKNTFPDETPRCVVIFHGHQNKVVPLMKLSIVVNLSNGAKFHLQLHLLIN